MVEFENLADQQNMEKTESLKKNRDFLRMYRTGSYYVGKLMVIYVKRNRLEQNRLGITAVRNYGNSVERNRVRRLIKENYRMIERELPSGWDIVFSARKNTKGILPNYKEIQKEMRYLLRKTGLFQ